MASRHTLRSLPGHLAFLLAILTATAISVTAVFSFFYEGWGQSVTTAAAYLAPPVLLVGICVVAVHRPRAGGLVQGPGWNWRQADGTYPSWSMLATYGVSPAGLKPNTGPSDPDAGDGSMERTGLCGYLSEDGTSLLPEATSAWRLPTADEVVRSLTRGGTSAGCTWDGRSPHATCERPPDKETPLWAPDQAPIYYLTSDRAGADHALGVNYTGGITAHRTVSASEGVGYRCVKAPK